MSATCQYYKVYSRPVKDIPSQCGTSPLPRSLGLVSHGACATVSAALHTKGNSFLLHIFRLLSDVRARILNATIDIPYHIHRLDLCCVPRLINTL